MALSSTSAMNDEMVSGPRPHLATLADGSLVLLHLNLLLLIMQSDADPPTLRSHFHYLQSATALSTGLPKSGIRLIGAF